MRKLFFLSVLLLTGIILPASTVHAADWEVEANDTIAGFGVNVDIFGAVTTNILVRITPQGGIPIEIDGRTSDRGRESVELQNTETEMAGVYAVQVQDDRGKDLVTTTFQVFPDALSLADASIELDDDRVEEGVWLEGFVLLSDRFGNPLPSRPVAVNSSRPDDEVMMLDDQTSEDGEAGFRFRSSTPGETILMAVDLLSGEVLKDRPVVTVERSRASGGTSTVAQASSSSSSAERRMTSSFRASLLDEYNQEEQDTQQDTTLSYADYFDVLLPEDLTVVPVNEPIDVIIIARDQKGKQAESYVGKVKPETSAPDAQFPEITTFLPSDRGYKRIALAFLFGSPGLHTIHVYDVDDPEIEGELQVRVVGSVQALPEGTIVITDPPQSLKTGKTSFAISGTAPPYINLELWDNDAVLETGGSDVDGKFRFSVRLNPEVASHVLTVKEGIDADRGLGRISAPIVITLDRVAPDINAITLAPETVEPGQSVQVTVKGEAGQKVRASLEGGQPQELIEQEGKYVGSITAPDKPGTYAVTVTIVDEAENTSEQSKHFTVMLAGLPAVANVSASAAGTEIVLQWDPVPSATRYRVYYGFSSVDFAQSKDTPAAQGTAVTTARMTGLQPGTTYFFAVTALDAGNRESTQRSPVVSASTVGSLFRVQAVPQVNGASLSWIPAPGADTVTYRIRYGLQSGSFMEQRLVDGVKQSAVLTDLINGVPYYISFAALQRDGSVMEDAVEVSVIPGINGLAGFHPVAADPIPGSIGGSSDVPVMLPPSSDHAAAPPGALPSPPSVHPSGLPFTVIVTCAFLLGAGMLWFRIRRRRMEQALMITIARTYHGS